MKTKKCKTCLKTFQEHRANGIIISRLCQKCLRIKNCIKLALKKAKKKEKKENSISRLTKQADILFSQFIRQRDKLCQKCGSNKNLQCAHIISRSIKRLRWASYNALVLCAGCHLYWSHKEPLEFSEWIKSRDKDIFEKLLKEKKEYFKLTPEFLKEIIKKYDTEACRIDSTAT